MYYVAPFVRPSLLTGHENGRIPSELLTRLSIGGSLLTPAYRSWAAMTNAAALDGLHFVHEGAYRTYDAQVSLFLARYETPVRPGRPVRAWQGVLWSLRPGMATAAVPGTSNHGWGCAIDVAVLDGLGIPRSPDPTPGADTAGRRAYRWLIEHYAAYGWSHEFSSPLTEPWHIRYVAGDTTPQALRSEQAPVTPPPTPQPPAPQPQPEPQPEETDMLAIYRPTFDSPGYTPAWFAVFASGAVRRATNADVRLAELLKLPTIELDSADQYDDLYASSGSIYGGRPQ